MEKSNHKNFVELYGRNRDIMIQNDILPYQEAIFNLFGVKFEYDAKKDLERGRKKLFQLGENCATNFNRIHSLLKGTNVDENDEDEIFRLVENIVNMDYGSVKEFFDVLKGKYQDNQNVYNILNEICDNISEMRRISKKHTNIITN